MGNGEVLRPVTRAQRGFGPEQLAGLGREEVRKLCHALLLAEGAAVDDYRSQTDFDEFTVSTPGLWHTRRLIVRIYHRIVEQSDLDDTHAFAMATGAVEALVLPTVHGDSIKAPPGVVVIPPAATSDRITASSLARWVQERPSVAVDRLELTLQLASTTLLDPVGIQWLPSLALNELPSALADTQVEPQDLLERKTFRLLTATFRFGGVRYGESARGKALPDSVLHWPDGSGVAVMVDCKAASSGYTMTSDHLLRFVNYWETLAPELTDEGLDLQYLLVVSSYFPGADGDRHPFNNRLQQLGEKTGLNLAYVMASDLAWLAAETEALDVPLADRARIDWHSVLQKGLVTSEHLTNALGEARH